eukprot:scaffold180_cov311-Pinguiococcus_pyrenoidosus.AAC.38
MSCARLRTSLQGASFWHFSTVRGERRTPWRRRCQRDRARIPEGGPRSEPQAGPWRPRGRGGIIAGRFGGAQWLALTRRRAHSLLPPGSHQRPPVEVQKAIFTSAFHGVLDAILQPIQLNVGGIGDRIQAGEPSMALRQIAFEDLGGVVQPSFIRKPPSHALVADRVGSFAHLEVHLKLAERSRHVPLASVLRDLEGQPDQCGGEGLSCREDELQHGLEPALKVLGRVLLREAVPVEGCQVGGEAIDLGELGDVVVPNRVQRHLRRRHDLRGPSICGSRSFASTGALDELAKARSDKTAQVVGVPFAVLVAAQVNLLDPRSGEEAQDIPVGP